MLPEDEIDTLLDAVAMARALAHVGQPGDGYTFLVEALHAAQERSRDAEWLGKVVAHYEKAMADYAARHRIGRA